jgi:ADP-heptose:LPS heptosyltransferase
MPPCLHSLPRDARILVIRLRSLGDCVLTTPALSLLKQYRSDFQVGVMVEDRFREIYTGNPDLCQLLPPSQSAAFHFRPHLTLNLHGGTRSAVLTACSLARQRAGFAHYRHSWVYNVKIPRAQEILGEERKVHTAEHVASAMFSLGVPQTEIPRARLFVQKTRKNTLRTRFFCVFHAFASAAEKAWPPMRFLALARQVRDELHLDPVFLGGPQDDLQPFAEFECLSNAPLERVKQLLSEATLFIGNDSGPAHMAAAFGLPVVVLFGSSDPVIWAPWRTRSEVLAAPQGLKSIAVAEVFEAAQRLGVKA